MADLTWNAVTAVGAMEYPEAVYVSSMDRIPPTTTLPHGFNVHQVVLIWYCRDLCWYEGKVVRFRGSEFYEVEFCAGGPRIRNWYELSRGLIRPDTPSVREDLKTHGFVIVTKVHNSCR